MTEQCRSATGGRLAAALVTIWVAGMVRRVCGFFGAACVAQRRTKVGGWGAGAASTVCCVSTTTGGDKNQVMSFMLCKTRFQQAGVPPQAKST